MANRELTQVAARAHDQRVGRTNWDALGLCGNEIEYLIDSLQALRSAQVVEKDAGKARPATWARKDSAALCLRGRRLLADKLPDGDDQHSARAKCSAGDSGAICRTEPSA
jgi:hypothetical protein